MEQGFPGHAGKGKGKAHRQIEDHPALRGRFKNGSPFNMGSSPHSSCYKQQGIE